MANYAELPKKEMLPLMCHVASAWAVQTWNRMKDGGKISQEAFSHYEHLICVEIYMDPLRVDFVKFQHGLSLLPFHTTQRDTRLCATRVVFRSVLCAIVSHLPQTSGSYTGKSENPILHCAYLGENTAISCCSVKLALDWAVSPNT